jgi:hypothetical protein
MPAGRRSRAATVHVRASPRVASATPVAATSMCRLGMLRARRRRGRRRGRRRSGRRARRRRGGPPRARGCVRTASTVPARMRSCALRSRGRISARRRPFREQPGSLRARRRRGRRRDGRRARRRLGGRGTRTEERERDKTGMIGSTYVGRPADEAGVCDVRSAPSRPRRQRPLDQNWASAGATGGEKRRRRDADGRCLLSSRHGSPVASYVRRRGRRRMRRFDYDGAVATTASARSKRGQHGRDERPTEAALQRAWLAKKRNARSHLSCDR